MRVEIPLGGADQNYNSRKSRAQAVNCYIETNQKGDFLRVRRTPGLVEFATVGAGPIRGMFTLKDRVFLVSGQFLYSINSSGTATQLGNVGGSTELVSLAANGTDENQIMVVSAGNGYIYDDSSGFRQITDVDFSAENYVASLNQVFYVNRPDSNVFLGSEVANGDSWPTLKFASAEQNPDTVAALVALKSALYVMGTSTIEYWQTDSTATGDQIPLRPVVGASIERGVGAARSVATFQDSVFWLADDYTVWMMSGLDAKKISDLNLDYAIRGEGFGENLGYSNPELAEGFFIDHPTHKLYVLTFPQDGATWVYDVMYKTWHRRQSSGLEIWRGRASELAFGQVLVGDYRTGQVWTLVDGVFTEGGEPLPMELTTPSIISDQGPIYITEIEFNMEVGLGDISTIDGLGVKRTLPREPMIELKYSKDGGVTFTPKRDLSVGSIGDRHRRVKSRLFGRIRQNSELCLKIRITDDVPVVLYNLYADIERG